MRYMNLKKYAFSILIVVLMGQSYAFAQSTNDIEDHLKIIDFVDNDKGMVGIFDTIYYLKLNAKVYDQGKRVNRYALKEGQRVDFEISYKESQGFIDSISILGK